MMYILVLGKRLNPDGSITEIYRQRLDKAAERFHHNISHRLESRLIISGGHVNGSLKTEACAGYEYICRTNPEISGRVILEELSLDTLGNAAYTKQIFLADGVTVAELVTSRYHLLRAYYDFTYIFGDGFKIMPFGAAGLALEESIHFRTEAEKFVRTALFFKEYEIEKGEHEKVMPYLTANIPLVEDAPILAPR